MKGNPNQRALWVHVLLGLLVMGFLFSGKAEGEPEGSATGIAVSNDFIDTLSEQERSWLRDHPVISVVHDPDWPPVEFTDGHGELSGMSGDYLNLVEQRLGVKFKRIYNLSWQEAYARQKRWEIDMATCVARTPERTEFWAFTKPYLTIPIVIATQSDVTYIASMKELFGKKVALVKGYAIDDWITRDLPEIELARVTTAQEGLKMLQRGEVFAYIDNLLIIGDYQAKMKITNIKIAGQTPYENAQCMAVRKDWAPLAGILQKALESISETERNDIYRKWLPIHYEHGFNYTLLWQPLGVFATILLVLAFWNRKLAREIKQRKRAEEALRQANLVVENSPVVLFRWKAAPGWPVDMVSQNVINQFGYAQEELLSGAVPFASLVHPEDLDRTGREVREYSESATERFRQEYRIITKSGEVRWVDDSTMVERNADGQIDFYQGIVIDITERRRAEQAIQESETRFRQVVEASPIPIGISDLSGRIEYINPRFLETFGYALEEVSEVDLWFQRAYPDPVYRQTVVTQWRQAIEKAALAQRPSDPLDVHITCRDGSERIMQIFGSLMGDRLVVMGTDLTERIRSEEALRSLLAELEIHRATLEEQVRNRTAELSNANQYLEKAIEELKLAKQAAEMASVAKSDFIAHMSHELRTPLNHIIGFTELVVDKHFGDLNASQEDYLTDVLASSRHLLSLVNDVLDLSKVEAGKLELALSPVDLRHLLQNSLFMVKEKAMKHGLKLSTDFNEIPESIEADERKLKQIVYNLLSNAVKFTPDGGRVELCAEVIPDVSVLPIVPESAGDGPWIRISIKDTGIGLKKEDLNRIFNSFEQVESTLNRKFQGTGLGLALVRNLVALHGGQVWAESEGENRGTVVSFDIPTTVKTI
ncbi:MAG: transporter substrate-binding domain-containing protein [Pseudomonadota bacterium]